MKNKQLLALASEAIQLKDELFGLESIREAEKKKEHDKLIVTEPTDRLGQFFWEHAREQYIHDAKERQLGNFNVPAYNFFKSVQILQAKFIVLKSEVSSLEVEDNEDFKDKLHQLAQSLSAIENCFLRINEIAMITACHRDVELALTFIEPALTEVRCFADAFNNNPSMETYKKLCSKRDFFAYQVQFLEYKIKYIQRESVRSSRPERIESAYASDKVFISAKNDLTSIDENIESLRYQHNAILYDELDKVNAGTYEGGVFEYLQFYWLITLVHLYKAFVGEAPAINAKSSTAYQDASISTSERAEEIDDYSAAAHLH